MKTLILCRGVPGSGKSTISKIFISLGYQHFEADMYFMNEEGEYKFDIDKLHQAHNWCQLIVESRMVTGKDIIVSNTLTTEKELKPYYELADEHGYLVHSIIKENRHLGENQHSVPEEVLERMKQRFTIKL